MNIFYLHKDPVIAAKVQYNKHVVKMILESAQMLCTAHHEIMGEDADVPYKRAHVNHPSTIWCRRSAENYSWLYDHMMALGKEYTKRYGKQHLTIIKCRDFLSIPPKHIQGNEWLEPPQCMPDEYKADSSLIAYWNYYENEKHTVKNKNEKKIIRPSNINELCEY